MSVKQKSVEPTVRDGRKETPSTLKASVVKRFNLENIIKEMRMRGKTYKEIADNINASRLIPDGYRISYSAISSWCANNGYAGDVSNYESEEAINVYQQQCKALKLILGAIDIISVQMDEINTQLARGTCSVKDVKGLVDSLDKLTARQESLSISIAAFQERVYKYQTVSKVIQTIMAKLSTLISEEDYCQIKATLANDPILFEAVKEIQSSESIERKLIGK